MFKIEIAGRTLHYKYLADLHQKLVELQTSVRKQRAHHDAESTRLRSEERALEKIIHQGNPTASQNAALERGK